MANDFDEREVFFNRRTDKTIISKRFNDSLSGQQLRIASHVVEGQSGLKFAKVAAEIVLRQTPAGRYEIKAAFLDDDRSIQNLTIQKYSSKTGPLDRQYFTFVGGEIDTLINFIAGLKTVPLGGPAKLHISDAVLRDIVLDHSSARQIFAKNSELFLELAQQEDIARDLVAIGYRRKQLNKFDKLLHNEQYFSEEQQRLKCKPEAVWQTFF